MLLSTPASCPRPRYGRCSGYRTVRCRPVNLGPRTVLAAGVVLALVSTFVPSAAGAAVGLETFEVAPVAADPSVTGFKSNHLVARNASADDQAKLNVLLPGTDIEPTKMKEFVKAAADAGFPSIGLRLANNWGTGRLCGGESDRTCYEKVRFEAFDGVDRTSKINVTHRDSVTGRLAALLVYLDRKRPGEGWGRFLDSATQPKWSSIIFSGHSTGAGQAAFIGLKQRLVGVAVTSGPGDGSAGNLAPWIKPPDQNGTPVGRWYALSHAQEKNVGDHKAAWAKIGIPGPTVAVDGKDGKPPPYGGAQKLLTTAKPPDGNYHYSVAIDRSLVLADGKPALVPSWRHLLTQGSTAPGGDAGSPTVSVTSPVTGTSVSDVVTIAATVSDAGGIARVDFLVDGTVKGSDSSAPYSSPFDSTQVENGSHVLAAKAYDLSGNAAQAEVTVTVSNTGSSARPAMVASLSADTGSGSASSLAVTHDVPGTGTDRYLVVGVAWRASTVPDLSGVSYAGTGMQQLGPTVSPDPTMRLALFGVADPVVGSEEVSVTLSGAAGVAVSARTFTGVDASQLAPVTAKGKSATVSVGLPATSSDLLVDWAVNFGDAAKATPGQGQSVDVNRATTSSGFDMRALTSQKVGAPAPAPCHGSCRRSKPGGPSPWHFHPRAEAVVGGRSG